jgi:hypothetical protein
VRTREVAAEIDSTIDLALESELQAVFGADYQRLEQPASEVAAGDWLPIAGQLFQDGLAELIEQSKSIPRERLRQMRVVLRRWADDEVFNPAGDTGPYGKAAQRMIQAGAAEVVIMGHTHLARQHGPENKADYINTGTWADLISVPREALADSDTALDKLEALLRGLVGMGTGVREFRPSYADVRIAAAGHVERARLEII